MKQHLKRWLLMGLGTLAVGLGLLGIVLPLLPTTPFLLLAAWCYIRSSKRLHTWLLSHPVCGEYIYNYTEHRSVRRSSKRVAIITLWTSMAVSMYIVQKTHVTLILIVIGTLVSAHILSLRTFESLSEEEKAMTRQRCVSLRAKM